MYEELLSPEEAEGVAMAAHELLENVVKYSVDGESSFDFEISGDAGDSYVRLVTRNKAAPEHREGLHRLVERVSRAPDAVAVYDELIASSISREGSGLGLARIRAEAEMSVACFTTGDQVTIVAERRVFIRSTA